MAHQKARPHPKAQHPLGLHPGHVQPATFSRPLSGAAAGAGQVQLQVLYLGFDGLPQCAEELLGIADLGEAVRVGHFPVIAGQLAVPVIVCSFLVYRREYSDSCPS